MEEKREYKKGLWTAEEDKVLMDYIRVHGKGKWNRIAKVTGLKRCGKSCRLRWMNYLSPGVKRGDFSEEENDLIIRLHNLLGNRWSLIAGRVPGRTDNQVKNHWNTHLSKKLGVKKGKAKSGGSSQLSSKLLQRQNNGGPPEYSNTTVPVAAACSQKAEIEGNSYSPIDFGGGLSAMSDDYEKAFWFSYNDLKLHNSNVMEFLDHEPLDFVWSDL
ncbi:hypothetical protein SLA2020_209310 [Shorea laevis]